MATPSHSIRSSLLRLPVFGLSASLCVAFAGAGTPARAAQQVVTSVLGEARQGDARLSVGDPIATDRAVDLPLGSRSSALIGGTAIVQLCEESTARFHESGASGSAVVELERGALKAMVDVAAGDPLVIRTPTAEAFAVDAAVLVEVDAATGTTTVASLERSVRVRATAQGRMLVVGSGEQVVIAGARPPGPVHRFDASVLRSTHLCIDDEPFRRAAARVASARQGRAAVDRIALADVPAEPGKGGAQAPKPWQARQAKSKQEREQRAERDVAFWGAVQGGGAGAPAGAGPGSDPSGGPPQDPGVTQPPIAPPPTYEAPAPAPPPTPVFEPAPLPPEPPPPAAEPCTLCGLPIVDLPSL